MTRIYRHYAKGAVVVALVGAQLFVTTCDHNPTGPKLTDYKKLAVFGILNPSVQGQHLLVTHTLSFNEVNSQTTVSLEVSDVTGKASGPDGDIALVVMPPDGEATESAEKHFGTDFVSGSGNFNYLLDGPEVRAGQTYDLAVSSEKYGDISATTTIPGPFEITELNIEPTLSKNNLFLPLDSWGMAIDEFRPDSFRVTWSKSVGAAGYLVDITILEYDIPENIELDYRKGGYWWPDFGDTSRFIQIPYREIPLDFGTSEDSQRRGILTRDTFIEFPLDILLELIDFPREYEYRFHHILRIRVYVHALNEISYDYVTFEYLASTDGEEVIGQEFYVPDLSNVENGVGIWGGAYTQSATSRLCDYILQPEYFGPEDKSFHYWYEQFNEFCLDQISNDEFSRLLFPSGINPPVLLQPEDNAVLGANQNQTLAWQPVEGAGMYLLVIKPHYFWFAPGNLAFFTEDNHYEISLENIPYRDCKLEWYVKGFSSYFHFDGYVVEVPPDKSTLVFCSEIATPWSESRFLTTESGELPGFEDRQPTVTVPSAGAVLAPTGTLTWTEVDGADAYLVYCRSGAGEFIIAVTKETEISPPFPEESDYVDGLRGASRFQSGVTYTVQVCGVRVKSGALGFALGEPRGEDLPQVYPRYQHPSGIMLLSKWSEPRSFVVQ